MTVWDMKCDCSFVVQTEYLYPVSVLPLVQVLRASRCHAVIVVENHIMIKYKVSSCGSSPSSSSSSSSSS